ERVRLVQRHIYNREQFVMFDNDVGHYVEFTPLGEKWAQKWNSHPDFMEQQRSSVDWYCRNNYEAITPFSEERRGERVPSGPALVMTLEPLKTSPEPSALFEPIPGASCPSQGHPWLSQSIPVHPNVVPNGDWSYQLLVLLERPPRRGLSYTCQVEHVSLEQPLRRHW
ncbi:HB2L protein, partial [Illadopsis cleaveri]|nr:HB2L protein [Illadopsis cleaveri]